MKQKFDSKNVADYIETKIDLWWRGFTKR